MIEILNLLVFFYLKKQTNEIPILNSTKIHEINSHHARAFAFSLN